MRSAGIFLTIFSAIILLTHPINSSFAQQGNAASKRAKEILRQVDDMWRGSSSHSLLTLRVKTAHYTRNMRLEGWSKGNEKTLVRILAPLKEKGTATLKSGNSIYSYLPKTDRTIRLTSGMMMGSWMGSHFTNDDLMRETSYLDDYDAVIGTEERDGVTYLKATLTPKPDAPVVYSELIFLITPGDWVPVRSEYYDDGDLIRAWIFDEIRTVAGRSIPMRMTILPVDAPEERTVVEYLELELDVPVDENLFTRQGLRRAAKG